MAWAVIARLADRPADRREVAAVYHRRSLGNLCAAGIIGTLTAAALSIVLALISGFLLRGGRLSPAAAIRWPCAVVVEIFRAIPCADRR